MIKKFDKFSNDIDIYFGDIVTYMGRRKHHKRYEKAMVFGITYNEKNGFAYYRIEFLDGSQKICREQLIQKITKKTYDSIKFEFQMKKKKSYLHYKEINDKSGNFLFIKEKQKKDIARKEKKREEIRLKTLDIDPYGEENWEGIDNYDPDLNDHRWNYLNDGLNHNMKTYSEYIKENHIDIDPYNEEDWEDDIINPGDEVICIEDCCNYISHEDRTYNSHEDRTYIKKGDIKQISCLTHDNKSGVWFTDTPWGYGFYPLRCFKKI